MNSVRRHGIFKDRTLTFSPVKKTKKEVAELASAHVTKEKLRKERREEQERNVQRKNVLKARGKSEDINRGEDGKNEGDGPSADLEDEGTWDEDEEISDGEDSEQDDGSDDGSSEVEDRPPAKRPRIKGK